MKDVHEKLYANSNIIWIIFRLVKYYAKKVENAHPEHSDLNLSAHLSLASICDILRIRHEFRTCQTFDHLPRSKPENNPETFRYSSGLKVE
jgi:hypothetical protein